MTRVFGTLIKTWFQTPRGRFAIRITSVALVICAVLFSALLLATRYYIVPHAHLYTKEITTLVSQAVRHPVTIGTFEAGWDRFWPTLKLKDLKIHHRATQKILLTLPNASATLSWKTLLGIPSFRALIVNNPRIHVYRKNPDQVRIAGFLVDLKKNAGADSASNGVSWLLDQGRIQLNNAYVHYVDETKEKATEVTITDLNCTVRNGTKNSRYTIKAHINNRPVEMQVQARIPLFSRSYNWRDWKGRFFFKTDQLDVAKALAKRSSIVRQGFGSVSLWADFDHMHVSKIAADVALNSLHLQLQDNLNPLQAKDVRAHLEGSYKNKTLALKASKLTYQVPSGPKTGPLEIGLTLAVNEDTMKATGGSFTCSAANLEVLQTVYLETLPLPKAVEKEITKFNPRGKLTNFNYTWKGDFDTPRDWSVKTNFNRLTIAEGVVTDGVGTPGCQTLTGEIFVSPLSGYLKLESGYSKLIFPGVFPNPQIGFISIKGNLDWVIEKNKPLTVKTSGLTFSNSDLTLTAVGSWKNTGGAGTIDLKATLDNVKAERTFVYLPYAVSLDTRAWLKAALRHGYARNASCVLRGQLDGFPWHNAPEKGLFEIRGMLDDITVDFLPSMRLDKQKNFIVGETWPVITKLDGDILFKGSLMSVNVKEALTQKASLYDVKATIPHMGAGNVILDVVGHAKGDLGDMLRYLEVSPVGEMLGNAFKGAKGENKAIVDLALTIPLSSDEATRVKGKVHLQNNALDMHWPIPPMKHITGSVAFTDSGASAETLSLETLKSTVNATIVTNKEGQIDIGVSGKVAPQELHFFKDTHLVKAALKPLKGKTPFVANVQIKKGKGVVVTAQTNLQNVVCSAPAPFNKKENETWPTRFSLTPATIRGETGYLLKLVVGNKLDLALQMPQQGSALAFGGTIGIGKKGDFSSDGLKLDVALNNADAGALTPFISALIQGAELDEKEHPSMGPGDFNRIETTIKNLMVGKTRFTDIKTISKQTKKNVWACEVDSTYVKGKFNWDFTGKEPLGLIKGHFSRFTIPTTAKKELKEALETQRTHPMPLLNVKADDFTVGNLSLGRVEQLTAKTIFDKTGYTWLLDTVKLANANASLNAKIKWDSDNKTTASGRLTLIDGGKFLKHLGYDGLITHTRGTLDANLAWEGALWDINLPAISGKAKLNLEHGVFEKIDTGIGGAFISLFSIQSLIKRLTLDFFDIANSGYTFDSFSGDLAISKGVVTSENTKIIGPKASIMFSGTTDFVKETINAKALVVPDINAGGASLALALINPAVGLGTFVTQFLFRDAINSLFAETYEIKGNLKNPTMTKVKAGSEKEKKANITKKKASSK